MDPQEVNKEKNNSSIIITIIVIACIVLITIGVLGYYICMKNTGVTTTDQVIDDSTCASCNQRNSSTPVDSQSASLAEDMYANSRYGFAVDNLDGFTSFESDNGDGITYTTANNDGTGIKVYGSNNAEGLDLSSYLDREGEWLNENTGNAEEIATNEVQIDDCVGERRAWEYTTFDGNKTIEEKAVCLKDNVFYTLDLLVLSDNYSQYSSIFDDEIFSFRFK